MVLLSLALLFYENAIQAQQMNGFDLSNTAIPATQILSGGPPRDGIPAIDNPVFKPIKSYKAFGPDAEVLGVYYNGMAKAFPINILDWHEVVNDEFMGQPVVVTYCPLCGSGISFKAKIDGMSTEFGVSGLLYNSDVLLYDRATESLWSQIMAQAISGPQKGHELEMILTQRMTLGSWKRLYPNSLVLTPDTGYDRNYHQGPYGSYNIEDRTLFPLAHENNSFDKKEWVIGIEVNGLFKAYPIKQLVARKSNQFQDELAGTSLKISWDKNGENIMIKTKQGEEVIALQMFWFAWVAFHPETLIMSE